MSDHRRSVTGGEQELWVYFRRAVLAAHLGSAITDRVTLHKWPLSCVQRVTTAAGRRLIYKSQAAPSVESGFYAAVRSSLPVAADQQRRTGG